MATTYVAVSAIHEFSAEEQLARSFDSELRKWCGKNAFSTSNDPRHTPGEPLVRDAIARLEAALSRLGARTGHREDAARAWLTDHRDRLRAALDAFESLGVVFKNRKPRFEGPAGVALVESQRAARAAVKAAKAALDRAEPEAATEARAALDRAEAMQRKANRDLAAFREAASFPTVPPLDCTSLAESETRSLTNARPAIVAMHAALDQGRDASPDVARLYVCFEPRETKANDVFDLRWRRYLAAGGE